MLESRKQIIPCPFPKIHPSELKRDESYFMSLAYNQSIEAWNKNEVPVGAVIELEGQVIAKAHNLVDGTKDPTAHAEILAITQAANFIGDWRLNGATLYVTKEPCPMCSGSTFMSRISKVVYGIKDPKMGCMGGATNLNDIETLNHHLEIQSGVMEEECLELFQAFFQFKRLASKD